MATWNLAQAGWPPGQTRPPARPLASLGQAATHTLQGGRRHRKALPGPGTWGERWEGCTRENLLADFHEGEEGPFFFFSFSCLPWDLSSQARD